MTTTDAATIQDKAREAYQSMEHATREDGSGYVRVKDDAPEWVRDLAHAAHGDMLPDDWRYDVIQDALGTIADADEDADLDDLASDFSDEADVYNSDLLAWVGSNGSRSGYVDEAVEDFGAARDFYHSLQMGQYMERGEVFGLVLSALRESL
jgi:hypothetical protein